MEQRYIIGDRKGWLKVKLDRGKIISLPEYIKVNFLERISNRDKFEILEGVHKGEKASVSARGATTSWLGSPMPSYKIAVSLTFTISTSQLQTPIGDIQAITDSINPILPEIYPIQLPDFPHNLGQPYLDQATKALTWFYLGTGNAVQGKNDRYLHTGLVSEGCVTVQEIDKWDYLYKSLIRARASGGKKIGKLTVLA